MRQAVRRVSPTKQPLGCGLFRNFSKWSPDGKERDLPAEATGKSVSPVYI